jgi:hypothetical protein
MQGFI